MTAKIHFKRLGVSPPWSQKEWRRMCAAGRLLSDRPFAAFEATWAKAAEKTGLLPSPPKLSNGNADIAAFLPWATAQMDDRTGGAADRALRALAVRGWTAGLVAAVARLSRAKTEAGASFAHTMLDDRAWKIAIGDECLRRVVAALVEFYA